MLIWFVAVMLKVTSLLSAKPVQVKTLVFVAELYVNDALILVALQILSFIVANSVLLEVTVSVIVSFLQFCSNKTANKKVIMSESFFIYDCLAKERLLLKKNINRTAFFTQFNNCVFRAGE